MINVSKPSLTDAEAVAAAAVLKSGWVGQGSQVAAFEQACRERIGCRHFIALSSCTKAIEVALIAAGLNSGDEVIVPSLTYASVIQVVLKLGLRPVFADIDPQSLNITSDHIAPLLTAKTRAVMPLHFRSHACDIQSIKELADDHNLVVIEDAAHAFGSSYEGTPVGAESTYACFSFGPLKNISCIEGGGIATSDDAIAQRLIAYRNMGMNASTWQRYHEQSTPWHYTVDGPGDKCSMNDVNAAVGWAQLQRFDEIKQKKRRLLMTYTEQLADQEDLTIPAIDTEHDLPYIFSVLVNNNRREQLMQHMLDAGITTAVHYYPNHLHPFFAPYSNHSLPVTESVGNSIVTLPSYTDLTEHDQHYVIDTIKGFLRTHRHAAKSKACL